MAPQRPPRPTTATAPAVATRRRLLPGAAPFFFAPFFQNGFIDSRLRGLVRSAPPKRTLGAPLLLAGPSSPRLGTTPVASSVSRDGRYRQRAASSGITVAAIW